MSQEDVTQIKVDGQAVGIMGLKTAMEAMAKEYADKPDDEVGAELLKRLSEKNYIPDRVKESYAKAFLREFKKFLGKPYEQEVSGGVEIKVLGQGCVQCDRLERELMEVMAEIDLATDLEHVREIKEIGKYGVMGMPALLINGKVMSVGRVPPKTKLKEWLKEAQG
ncbi:MAG: thioredoxin family protein [Desulfobacteraceae bacterium]|nr:thioredoxin family protein [Desulfobacteraceae bacterium]